MSVNPPSNAISTKRKPMDHPNSDRPEKTHKANTAPPVPLDSRPPSDLQESPRWHPYHSDGNVILRADDGTLFGADSWRLAKARQDELTSAHTKVPYSRICSIFLNRYHSDIPKPQDG
ncbi:hypothetical protein I204_05320 [Kwoniella mangroviensis CBS 8886]|nr:hypothetical protein I204_05320 [Kwoniella mangroviensis CBS 8886]